jgi:hypothetical protein
MEIEQRTLARNRFNSVLSPAAREAKEELVEAAELWFEAIIGGRFNKIGPRQGELLAAIEKWRRLKPPRGRR